jgi:hypothetical protein
VRVPLLRERRILGGSEPGGPSECRSAAGANTGTVRCGKGVFRGASAAGIQRRRQPGSAPPASAARGSMGRAQRISTGFSSRGCARRWALAAPRKFRIGPKLLWIDELRELLAVRGLALNFVVSAAAALRRPSPAATGYDPITWIAAQPASSADLSPAVGTPTIQMTCPDPAPPLLPRHRGAGKLALFLKTSRHIARGRAALHNSCTPHSRGGATFGIAARLCPGAAAIYG